MRYVDDVVREVLSNMPNECNFIDYKQIPYKKEKYADFIKDVLAFLNCIESLDRDKFIIIGVENERLRKIGLKLGMPDDAAFQDLLDKISPRPCVSTGTISFENLDFGYICIPKTNNLRPYATSHSYPSNNPIVNAGTYYIRKGSKNTIADRYDLEKIFSLQNQELPILPSLKEETSREYSADLALFALIGGWNHTNHFDKEIIEKFIQEPYDSWIIRIKDVLQGEGSYINFHKNIWSTKGRETLIRNMKNSYYDYIFDDLQAVIVEVLSERNPKFDLRADERWLSKFYDKNTKYSTQLRTGLAEALPILSSMTDIFPNSSRVMLEDIISNTVHTILDTKNWEVWAGLEWYLPALAEAAPAVFIKSIEENILAVKQLFKETENDIVSRTYSGGLTRAIELVAWDPENFVHVCCVIVEVMNSEDSKEQSNLVNILSKILLPWRPQTLAPVSKRETVVKILLNEYADIGWKLLMKLIPGVITTTSSTYKPKWRTTVLDEVDHKITNLDYYLQNEIFLNLSIEYAESDSQRLIDLINVLDNISDDWRVKFLNVICADSIVARDDEYKYIIWERLSTVINRHKRYNHTDWAFSDIDIKRMEIMRDKVEPKALNVKNRIFFKSSRYDLFFSEDSKENSKQIFSFQVEAIKEILPTGLIELFKFNSEIEDSYSLGFCFGKVDQSSISCNDVFVFLDIKDSKKIDFIRGFVVGKYQLCGFDWIEEVAFQVMDKFQKAIIFAAMPFYIDTWILVENIMGDEQEEYWNLVDALPYQAVGLDDAIQKLIEFGCPIKAIDCITYQIDEGMRVPSDLAFKALTDATEELNGQRSVALYNTRKIIRYLQKQEGVAERELVRIEWMYLAIMGEEGLTPVTLERKLATEPAFFNEILCLAYKEKGAEKRVLTGKEETIAINAHRLLNSWRIIPGSEAIGELDKQKLTIWIDEMKEMAANSDRLDMGLNVIGGTLYYAPADKDGLWINKNVAELLNKREETIMRDAYTTKIFNERGAHFIDRTGAEEFQLASHYFEKADQLELNNFFRLASSMRELARDYERQGKIYIEE
ncbi:ATP-binding protein [Listeria sp. SHR_NRA_18]|uniref:ATP-binding protein n=1 Tax=Listeria TaxID=1637 RepID=UPI00051DE354|nr:MULTISPECIES: ATP-binding protein [Listeria]KGL46701.1 hypothetical protein EP56_00785 [Listeriaceae bacterium FSL A5-0209]KMT61983.1 hypothetical protein X559_1632 [Listeria newyorkensis]RQW65917.1 ATP-binding protein [Listeria sp. SHR_NRA_18]